MDKIMIDLGYEKREIGFTFFVEDFFIFAEIWGDKGILFTLFNGSVGGLFGFMTFYNKFYISNLFL